MDDVQFEKRSWQTRNRILLHGRDHILIVPVSKSPQDTKISEVVVNYQQNWQKRHWQTLMTAYAKAKNGTEALQILEPFYNDDKPRLLSEYTQAIIENIATALALKASFVSASALGFGSKRTIHLIEICNALNCDEYLSPRGSMEYLTQDNFEGNSSIKLSFQDFTPHEYTQYRSNKFVSHLSIIDVIANKGVEYAREYIS